ncbi:hypothetical protein BDR03DRAFT_1005544 [Suillus americanus]|nr:hypothetical protein BDR03DRAFT_1005544 [Suillus americanus]
MTAFLHLLGLCPRPLTNIAFLTEVIWPLPLFIAVTSTYFGQHHGAELTTRSASSFMPQATIVSAKSSDASIMFQGWQGNYHAFNSSMSASMSSSSTTPNVIENVHISLPADEVTQSQATASLADPAFTLSESPSPQTPETMVTATCSKPNNQGICRRRRRC